MRDAEDTRLLSGEKGAITIKAAVIVLSVLVIAFAAIKITPVYIEQQQVIHDTDELARKAALGLSAYNADKINKEILNICHQYSLPEGSINLASRVDGRAEITVKYAVPIDFIVGTYNWQVDYTAVGKGI